jgi:hypothetical protein
MLSMFQYDYVWIAILYMQYEGIVTLSFSRLLSTNCNGWHYIYRCWLVCEPLSRCEQRLGCELQAAKNTKLKIMMYFISIPSWKLI